MIHNVHEFLFKALADEGVHLKGCLLKPSMVIHGKAAADKATVSEVAAKTYQCLKDTVPADIGGVVFLSGGQSDEDAIAHLNAMVKLAKAEGGAPWTMTYSYGRALQHEAVQAWKCDDSLVEEGRDVIMARAKSCSDASTGSL